MTRNLTPRMEEKIITTSDLSEMKDKYLAENLYRKWTEDFIDESTGESVTIHRREIIAPRGTLLNNDWLPQINFFLLSSEISQVKVSNVSRNSYEDAKGVSVWCATAEINAKKKHFYLYANSVQSVLSIASDYIEQMYEGAYNFLSIKELSYINIVSFSKENALETDLKWYQILLEITYPEIRQTTQSEFVVKTTDAEAAKTLSEAFFSKYLTEREFTSTLLSAKNINIEAVIDHEFSKKYLEKGE